MSDSKPEKLPVIFRKDRNKAGQITAVFPTMPADLDGRQLTIYCQVGQHSGAGWDWYHSSKHRLAKPAEYADLLAELRDIYGTSSGPDDPAFELVPVRRITSQHRKAFRESIADYRASIKAGG